MYGRPDNPRGGTLVAATQAMASGLPYLLAARRCEIVELEQLARHCVLVTLLGRFAHELQRERGISNIFLGSGGARAASARQTQVGLCEQMEREVRAAFDALLAEPVRNGARLFGRIAVVLHALDALPQLRRRIAALGLPPAESTAEFVRLIAALLAVVFEAADSATDPGLSRALVALFNHMQGKEFAGQERAFGAAVFASGRCDAASRQHWQQLVELQQGCLQVFAAFVQPALAAADEALQDPAQRSELERLRRIGCAPGENVALDPALAEDWYRCCTRRIDAMQALEDLLTADLQRQCSAKIARAREELRDQQAAQEALARAAQDASPGLPPALGPQLERSVLAMVQQQAQRIQQVSAELESARAALGERKLIERAKGLLMAHRQLSEDEAYKVLRKMAMNQNRRLAEVAQAVLATAEVLPLR